MDAVEEQRRKKAGGRQEIFIYSWLPAENIWSLKHASKQTRAQSAGKRPYVGVCPIGFRGAVNMARRPFRQRIWEAFERHCEILCAHFTVFPLLLWTIHPERYSSQKKKIGSLWSNKQTKRNDRAPSCLDAFVLTFYDLHVLPGNRSELIITLLNAIPFPPRRTSHKDAFTPEEWDPDLVHHQIFSFTWKRHIMEVKRSANSIWFNCFQRNSWCG